jgi:hypothetical protein
MPRVTTDDYRRALETAAQEYEALGAARHRIDQRLGELAQTIATLSRLCGVTSTVAWGLTDACRTVLRSAGVTMTPLEIRDRLQAVGVDLSGYANALAAIHTTLKRLNDAGELRSVVAPGSPIVGGVPARVGYVWNRPPKTAMLGPDAAQVMREIAEKKRSRKRAKT